MADVTITGRSLAHCPFCGDHDVGVYHVQRDGAPLYFVSCEGCDAEGPGDPRPDEARRRWNQRV